MRVHAVFVGETRKFYTFQLLQEEKRIVGSIYFRKDTPLPDSESIQFVNPNHSHWSDMVRELISRARNGSKGKMKLERVLRERSHE